MSTTPPLQVSAVVFPGFELLDLFGPLEFFGLLPVKPLISVFAEAAGGVPSSHGPCTVADRVLSDMGSTDILLVPGGWGTRKEVLNGALLELLKVAAANSRFVASVCTGSALLAKAGLLDGRRATTNKKAFEWVVSQGPEVDWVRSARWVEDGNFMTSSGISAGMDMTLCLIQKLYGRETSLEVAERAEYLWNEDSSADPFAIVES